MKRNWKILLVFLMFAAQTYIVYQRGKTFSELMEMQRGHIEQRLSAEGVPPRQVMAFSFGLFGFEEGVKLYVYGVASFLIGTNFLIFLVLLTERRKGHDSRGEA